MKKIILAATISFMFPPLAEAQEQSMTLFEASQHSTSDHLFLNEKHFYWSNHQRDLSWPYASEVEKSRDWGLDFTHYEGSSSADHFNGLKFFSHYGQKISPKKYWKIYLGYHLFESIQQKENFSMPIGGGEAQGYFLQKNSLFAEFKIAKDYVYQDLQLPGGLNDTIQKIATSLELRYKPQEHWRYNYYLSAITYSDKNLRNTHRLQALYGISPGWPWIWIGVQGEHIENSSNSTGYWSPRRFASYGAKLEASFPLYKNWSAASELQYNRIHENDLLWGNGHSYFIGLEYGSRDHFNIKFNISEIHSSQSGNTWKQKSYHVFISW